MAQATPPPAAPDHEPSLGTVEMLCEQLGELGLPIGPETARDILRAVLVMEAPRMEAHVREALQTSIDTIRVAAQAANGVLASTTPVRTPAAPSPPQKPVLDPPPARRTTPAPSPRSTPTRHPIARRNSDGDNNDDPGGMDRPVFRRPRGR